MHFTSISILVLSIASVYTATSPPAYSICHRRKAGIYCVNENIYVNCPSGNKLSCPPRRDETYLYTGKCVSNGYWDNKARCRYTKKKIPKGPCAGKKAGKYCFGEGILTCPDGTGLGCGYSATEEYIIQGKCKSRGEWDNHARCVMYKRPRNK